MLIQLFYLPFFTGKLSIIVFFFRFSSQKTSQAHCNRSGTYFGNASSNNYAIGGNCSANTCSKSKRHRNAIGEANDNITYKRRLSKVLFLMHALNLKLPPY